MVRFWNIRRPQGKECKTSAVTEQLGGAVSFQVQELDVSFAAPHCEHTSMKSACHFDAIKRSRRGGAAGMLRTVLNNRQAFNSVASLSASCIYGLVFISGPPSRMSRGLFEARSGRASVGGGGGAGCAFFTSRPRSVVRAGKLAIFLPAGSQNVSASVCSLP